jgi:hypothetical protein
MEDALNCVRVLCSILLISCASPSPPAAAPADDGALAKVGPELRALYRAHLAAQASGLPLTPPDPSLPIVGDRVLIDATASDDVNALKASLVALGMRNAVAAGRIVSGQLPIAAIQAMASLPSLTFAQAARSTTRGRTGQGVRSR